MRFFTLLLILAAPVFAQRRAAIPYAGRWDLTINSPSGSYPSWMEVSQKDDVIAVVVVGRTGSLHGSDNVRIEPIPVTTQPNLNESAVVMGDKTVESRLSFTTVESFGKPMEVKWQFDSAGGKITGTQKRADGIEGTVKGERAPLLKKKSPSKWKDPEALFNGKDLTGWEPDQPALNHWTVRDGDLLNESAGANLRTARKFNDFKLHIEYNCPAGGNSGVYLRGRYEVQIEYDPDGKKEDMLHGMGSIYGFLAPAVTMPPKPGEWESFDITLTGREVTIVRNGVLIVGNKQIPGITGGAIDSQEALPGPLYIQGDHTGGMKFRNITVSVPAN